MKITGSADQSAKMIDASNGRVVHTFMEQHGGVSSLALTSDDAFLIIGENIFISIVIN
jgi:hypothetical protein